MKLSFQNVFYGMAIFAAIVALLYLGQRVLVPFSIAVLIAFILYPVCKKVESWGVNRILSAFLTMFIIALLLSSLIALLSSQIASLTEGLSNFEGKLEKVLQGSIAYINEYIPLIPQINQEDIKDTGQELMKESGGVIVKDTLRQTLSVLSGLLMIVVYTFLLLIYRTGLKDALQRFAKKENRKVIGEMISEMQKVGQSYLLGMSIMIGILGITNSIVLLAFGIENAIFFGFLAALLAIIPYVGTSIGAAIPVMYAFITHDSLWVPFGIVISFWVIQFVESNYLSPRIVGGNLNLNALAAIMTLIIGGYIWGIAGMILFLPFTAIFKVFCSYHTPLKPLGLLLGQKLGD